MMLWEKISTGLGGSKPCWVLRHFYIILGATRNILKLINKQPKRQFVMSNNWLIKKKYYNGRINDELSVNFT